MKRAAWFSKGIGWIFALGLLLAVPGWAQGAGAASPCQRAPGFEMLDFWLGDWEVQVMGGKQGTNRIEKILAGCAVLEHWTDVLGNEGKSLFYYNPATATWRQVWITEDATRPGGLKEKTLIETFEDGGVRFQGAILLKDGQSYLDRTTLTPLDDGTVRQLIEVSSDEGQTWQPTFNAIYVPGSE